MTQAEGIVIGACKDCRFWELRPDAETVGWCRELTDVKVDIGVQLLTGGWDTGPIFGEKVFTSEDFGCTEFEARG